MQREGDYIPDLVVHPDRFVSNGPIHVEVKDSLLDFNANKDEQTCKNIKTFLISILLYNSRDMNSTAIRVNSSFNSTGSSFDMSWKWKPLLVLKVTFTVLLLLILEYLRWLLLPPPVYGSKCLEKEFRNSPSKCYIDILRHVGLFLRFR